MMRVLANFTFLFVFALLSNTAAAQPDFAALQQEWAQIVKSGEGTSGFYWEDKHLIYSEMVSSEPGRFVELVKSGILPGTLKYEHEQSFRHDDDRYMSVGKLIAEGQELILFTGWRKVEGHWKKEVDVILTQESPSLKVEPELSSLLEKEREKWVRLANAHNPEEHIKQSYTKEATYFGNGRKSEGRAEIAERYVYMENPNYQVDLEKEQLWNITKEKVLEVGRYFTGAVKSGTGGLYVIIWEKQEAGSWQIALDYNF